VYSIVLSAAARRTADAHSEARYADFEEICSHLSEFFPALEAARLVTRARLWDVKGYRYFDGKFPCLLFFEITEMSARFRDDVILIHLILPASR
jgi:hypothetical protein